MPNDFYVNEIAHYVGDGRYVTEYHVCYASPYRLGCFIAACDNRREANLLCEALNATLKLHRR